MDDEIPDDEEEELSSRAPEERDLVTLCKELNSRGARYLICGKAVPQLESGDIARYTVCRVADEVTVDLMGSAGGIRFADAEKEIVYREVDGIQIPFASPALLWRMKRRTRRAKDEPDLIFLRQLMEADGIAPPE